MITDPESARASQNFLCHTSHKMSEHKKLDALIKKFLSAFEDELAAGKGRAIDLVERGYEELKRTLPTLPSMKDVVEDIVDRLPRRRVRLVNSEGKSTAEAAGAPNFIVGGNIVGRGLTIPNLLVTYYLRKPKISQMDTMLQHARMFGYREQLMPLTRVFLPSSLAVRFNSLHQAERELRRLIPSIDALSAIPVQVIGELRPTRYGVLDTGSIEVIGSGKHYFPARPPFDVSAKSTKAIAAILDERLGSDHKKVTTKNEVKTGDLDLATAMELCDLFDSQDWNGAALGGVLRAVYDSCKLVFRVMHRRRRPGQGPELPTGALSGDELERAREGTRPTFFVLRQLDEHDVWDRKRFLYPTIVFPESMKNMIFNSTSAEEA